MRVMRPSSIVITVLTGPSLHSLSYATSSPAYFESDRKLVRSVLERVEIPLPQPQMSGRAANVILTFPTRTADTRRAIPWASERDGAMQAIATTTAAPAKCLICIVTPTC
jgi:hypothetical protein